MSINYYNKNAEKFIQDTFQISMEALIAEFIYYVPKGGSILDLGCGSGRDSLYFKEKGYDIYAVDGAEEMVIHTRKYIGDRVTLATFEEYTSCRCFDGIWALASLLHVPRKNIKKIIRKYMNCLNVEGVMFMSFKNVEQDYNKGGREFTCFTEKTLIELLNEVEGIEIVKIMNTVDVREDRENEKWISIIIKNKG